MDGQTIEGFTLLEALVALSIVAAVLSSIGALIATNVRGMRSIHAHLTRLETARSIMTALPDRARLVLGTMSGETEGHPWRVDVAPRAPGKRSLESSNPWQPLAVAVTVRSPSGGAMEVTTVRLQRRDGR
jgi:general secretion pathway protein I